jgi:hypothetical protein
VGQSAPLPLHAYECRILDRDLRVVRTLPLTCETDQEAKTTAADLFMRHDGEDLIGFEIWKDQYRLMVQLMQRPRDLQFPFEEAHAG